MNNNNNSSNNNNNTTSHMVNMLFSKSAPMTGKAKSEINTGK
jgi:hypothetical protein